MGGFEAICLLLLFAVSTTSADPDGFELGSEYVFFKDTSVTLTCPGTAGEDDEKVKWNKNGEQLTDKEELEIEVYDDKEKVLYECHRGSKTYYFYIKAKVCQGCVELNSGLVIGMMFGDILFTLGFIIIVYLCAKRKAPSAPRQRAAPRQAAAPPVPNPDYQVLNQATRSKDIYAEARRH